MWCTHWMERNTSPRLKSAGRSEMSCTYTEVLVLFLWKIRVSIEQSKNKSHALVFCIFFCDCDYRISEHFLYHNINPYEIAYHTRHIDNFTCFIYIYVHFTGRINIVDLQHVSASMIHQLPAAPYVNRTLMY